MPGGKRTAGAFASAVAAPTPGSAAHVERGGRSPAREAQPGKGPPHAQAVVVHVPLPGVVLAIVHEGRVEAGRGAVVKEERDGVAGYRPAADALGIERA